MREDRMPQWAECINATDASIALKKYTVVLTPKTTWSRQYYYFSVHKRQWVLKKASPFAGLYHLSSWFWNHRNHLVSKCMSVRWESVTYCTVHGRQFAGRLRKVVDKNLGQFLYRCCYITVDSAMAASQNWFCSYNLFLH